MGGLFFCGLLAAAAAGAAALRLAQLGQLAVRGGHKLLEPVLKAGGLRRGGLAAEAAAVVPAGAAHRTALACGAGRGIHSLFDGEVDAAVLVNADDLDLDLLPFLEMILHIVDIGIGDL